MLSFIFPAVWRNSVRTEGSSREAKEQFVSTFTAADGKYDYKLYELIQPFNNTLMYCGIVMVLLAVVLYVTACNKRRNYYISNYVVIGVRRHEYSYVDSAYGIKRFRGEKSKFLNVDFDARYASQQFYIENMPESAHYSESTLWFDLGIRGLRFDIGRLFDTCFSTSYGKFF